MELGDGVEIGSNTTIDRARIGRTYIGPMTKIDNLVQIGHNVKVAGYSGIIAQAGVAGSTQIGTGCLIWAQAGISGHIKIADGVQVGPQAGVPQSLDGSEKYVVGTPATTLKNVAAISLAPKMIMKLRQDVKAIKQELAALAVPSGSATSAWAVQFSIMEPMPAPTMPPYMPSALISPKWAFTLPFTSVTPETVVQ